MNRIGDEQPKAKMTKVKELANQIEIYERIAKGGKHEDGDTLGKNLYEEGYLIERTVFFKNGNPSYEAFVDGRAFVLREYFDNGSISYERVDAADDGWRGNINLHRFDNYGYTLLYTEFFRNGNLKKIEIFKDVSTFNWDKWTDYEIDVYELVGRYTYEAFEPNGLWWTCEEFYKNGNKKKISSYCKMSFINQDGKHSRHNEDHPIGTWSWFNSDGTLRRTEEYVASCKCVEKTHSDHISKMWKENLPSKVKVDNSYISKIRKTKKDPRIKKVIPEVKTQDTDLIDF